MEAFTLIEFNPKSCSGKSGYSKGVQMPTDLTRLHEVALGKLHGRGVGKTYLKCHDVAGVLCLGERYVLVIVSYLYDIHYIYPMLQQVLWEYGLEIATFSKASHKILLTNGAVIKFLTESIKLDFQLAGYSNTPIVFMRHND